MSVILDRADSSTVASTPQTEVSILKDYATGTEEALWNHVIPFIEKNRRIIIGRARKFMPFSSYSLLDFLQESYCSAMQAVQECPIKCDICNIAQCEVYSPIFWGVLNKNYCRMADIPSNMMHSYRECYGPDDNPPSNIPAPDPDPLEMLEMKEEEIKEGLSEEEKKSRIRNALSVMTPCQRKAWELLLNSKQTLTHKELARKMGYKARQRVSTLLKESLGRVREAGLVITELSQRSGPARISKRGTAAPCYETENTESQEKRMERVKKHPASEISYAAVSNRTEESGK